MAFCPECGYGGWYASDNGRFYCGNCIAYEDLKGKCGTCEYARKANSNYKLLEAMDARFGHVECHFTNPVIVVVDNVGYTTWPMPGRGDSCGRYKMRKKKMYWFKDVLLPFSPRYREDPIYK